jgi:hypothetical protein
VEHPYVFTRDLSSITAADGTDARTVRVLARVMHRRTRACTRGY